MEGGLTIYIYNMVLCMYIQIDRLRFKGAPYWNMRKFRSTQRNYAITKLATSGSHAEPCRQLAGSSIKGIATEPTKQDQHGHNQKLMYKWLYPSPWQVKNRQTDICNYGWDSLLQHLPTHDGGWERTRFLVYFAVLMFLRRRPEAVP